MVQSIESSKSWSISPKGEVVKLSKQELKELCPVRPKYNIGFAKFNNDSIKGVYLALSEEGLNNVLEFQKYQYLGTYDLFLTYSHEMFHMLEQDGRWASPDTVYNRARNPRVEHIDARIERHLIYELLLEANASLSVAHRDSITLQVLANYNHYKATYPDDLNAAKYYDRMEGIAHYYEIVSSLYRAYPNQVYSDETLANALRVLAASDNIKPYDSPAIDSESYVIGAWTCFLLDQVSEDSNDWKHEIMNNPNVTPLDILANYYSDSTLPEVKAPSAGTVERVNASIEEFNNKKVAPGIFRMLYQLIF